MAKRSASRNKTTATAVKKPSNSTAGRPQRFAIPTGEAATHVATHWIKIPPVRGDGSFTLDEVISAQAVEDIKSEGKLSFHAVGDTGRGVNTEQEDVADAMARDVDIHDHAASPAFLFIIGDIIYGPQKEEHYPDKFYRPYAQYPNSILAIPGNHDGDVDSLQAYLANFCQPADKPPEDASRFNRQMPSQPGAYWWLKAPFLDLVALFSNVDENIGTLSDAGGSSVQVNWLKGTLKSIADQRPKAGDRNALVIATHHPPYSRGLEKTGTGHPGNPQMLAQIDEACASAQIWPDAVLSGHAHNYQRYMRNVVTAGGQHRIIPYVIAGTGGIGLQAISTAIGNRDGDVSYVGGIKAYGYLTVTVSASQLSILFTQQADTHRSPLQLVTIDLKSGALLA